MRLSGRDKSSDGTSSFWRDRLKAVEREKREIIAEKVKLKIAIRELKLQLRQNSPAPYGGNISQPGNVNPVRKIPSNEESRVGGFSNGVKVKQLESTVENLKRRLIDTEETGSENLKKYISAQKEAENLAEKLSGLEKNIESKENKLSEVNSRLADTAAENRALAEQIEKLKKDFKKEVEKNSRRQPPPPPPPSDEGYKEKFERRERQLEKIKAELEGKKEELEGKEKAWRDLYRKKEREIEALKRSVTASPAPDTGELERMRAKLEESNRQWAKRYEEKQKEIAKLREDAAQEFVKRENAAAAASEKDAEVERLKDKIWELNARIEKIGDSWREKYRRREEELSMPAAPSQENSADGNYAQMLKVVKGFISKMRSHLSIISSSVSFISGNMSMPDKVEEHLKNINAHIAAVNKSRMYVIDCYRGLALNPVRTPLQTFVSSLAPMMEKVLAENEMKLVKVSHGENPMLNIDAQLLSSACMKIVANAVEASGPGGSLVFETDITEDGKYAVLRFIDSGTGIAEKDMAAVFEPFFTTKKDREGTGLHYARRLVRAHGGSVELGSSSDKGTSVSVYIPSVKNGIELDVRPPGQSTSR